jgi:hypothetical protein
MSARFGRCTERGVLAFEQRLGHELPAAYREFLLEHNGGVPEATLVKVRRVNSSVKHLHGLHKGPAWARLDAARKVYEGRMPEGLLPIGSDPFGNVYCLGLSGRWRGKVWFWDHEAEADEAEPPRTDNLELVAPDFASFLAKLRQAPVSRRVAPTARTLQDAASRGDLAAVDRLLTAGANPNARVRGCDSTPLMTAAAFGHVDIVERLLAGGADVHARSQHGHTAAVMASWADHRDVLRVLMSAGAEPETPHLRELFGKWRKRSSKSTKPGKRRA